MNIHLEIPISQTLSDPTCGLKLIMGVKHISSESPFSLSIVVYIHNSG